MSAYSNITVAIVHRSDAYKKATKSIKEGLVCNGYTVDSIPIDEYDIADLAIELAADKKPGTTIVRVEGEHDSAQEYVLPVSPRQALPQAITPNGAIYLCNIEKFLQSGKVVF